MKRRGPSGEMRDRVKAALERDPEGNCSDLAISLSLGISENCVRYHRRALGIESAQARRRRAPGARTVTCLCGRSYLVSKGRTSRDCGGCGQRLYLPPQRQG